MPLYWLFLVGVCGAIVIHDNTTKTSNGHLASKLVNGTKDDLVVLFTGDPQFNFECVSSNKACKQASESFRAQHNLSHDCGMSKATARTLQLSDYAAKKLVKQCLEIEAFYSNRLSREVIGGLINAMPSQPSALLINGDLTSYGHIEELEAFKKVWLNLPIRVLPLLGNHDYENNINDCVLNHCANRMLFWMLKYAEEQGLKLDYKKDNVYWRPSYTGSFSYSLTVCSESGRTCAQLIQVQHRPNYATHVESPTAQWVVRSSFRWLGNQLRRLRNTAMPVFISLHHMDAISRAKIKQLLVRLFRSRAKKLPPLRVYVLFAHLHHLHQVREECATQTVPFLYVGSVPNNRLTAVKISSDGALPPELFMLSANSDGSATVLEHFQSSPALCEQSEV